MKNIQASHAEAMAIAESANSMIRFRFQRSTSAPKKGPSRTCGSNPIIAAVARMVADPVVLVSHQMIANWTAKLPARETAWLPQSNQNLSEKSFGACLFM